MHLWKPAALPLRHFATTPQRRWGMEVVVSAVLELQVRQVCAYRCRRLLASCVDIEIEICGVFSFIFSREIKIPDFVNNCFCCRQKTAGVYFLCLNEVIFPLFPVPYLQRVIFAIN